MTNLKLQLSVSLLLAACSTTETPLALTGTYDFSGAQLVEIPAPPKPTGQLNKASFRTALARVQSRLASCAKVSPHPAGVIDVNLRLDGEDGSDATVASAEVQAFGNTQIESCMRDVLMTLELVPMSKRGFWNVHYPFSVDANG